MKLPETLRVLCLFLVLSFGAGAVRAQKNDDALFLRREVKIGEEVYGSRVFVPKNRKPKLFDFIIVFPKALADSYWIN